MDINVAIALIKNGQKYLVAQRGSDVHLPGLWEFPGGKQIPHETLEECVVREVLEELGIEIKINRFYGKFTHSYRDRTVVLHAYLCHIAGEDRALPVRARGVGALRAKRTGPHMKCRGSISTEKIRWASPKEILSLPFPEANLPLLTALADII